MSAKILENVMCVKNFIFGIQVQIIVKMANI